ncbi:hypothetical protein FE257_001691 [Aspergillus nanangensis]|uniref:NB-ARC domain-containing protein n=1 Tax=Aspergillus nanangensis TaxID=2582783 RepID=A0AAD4GNS9_ASPNN|nr:hypothetical protein FE257_001691 [Aspergillus nanangensis]
MAAGEQMAMNLPMWVVAVAITALLMVVNSSSPGYWTVLSASVCFTGACYSLLRHQRDQASSGRGMRYFLWSVFGLSLAWTIFLSPAHLFVPTLMDLWSDTSERPPTQFTEIVYSPDDGHISVDVYAIHGMGSNATSAWMHKDKHSQTRWLKDVLPAVEGLQSIRVIQVNHQSRWDANSALMQFNDHAEMVLGDIESLHKENPERPIIFIAHSFGGILLKKALVLAKVRSSSVASMTKGILFMGVPHRGSPAVIPASILSFTAHWRGSSTHLLRYMSPDCPSIQDLDAEFIGAFQNSHSPRPLPYICNFLEMRAEKVGNAPIGATVNGRSGNPHHGKIVFLDTDHRGLNKFQSAEDPNFVRFLDAFKDAFRFASTRSEPAQFLTTRLVSGTSNAQDSFLLPFELPFLRNSRFTGRDFILTQINDYFNSGPCPQKQCVIALYGPGGIGKTQIAVEYAHQYHREYTAVFWVDAASESSLKQSFVDIAKRVLEGFVPTTLKQKDMQQSPDEEGLSTAAGANSTSKKVDAAMNWFSARGNNDWLLIFDNFDDIELFDIRDFIPKTSTGSILITSRRKDLSSYWRGIEIPSMDFEEGKLLLIRSSGIEEENIDGWLIFQLLQLLGNYPLAIEQAGAYIAVQRSRTATAQGRSDLLQHYIDEYKKSTARLLQYMRPPSIWDYRNDTVLSTWEVSFHRIEHDTPQAAQLLLLCGFLSNQDIFEGLLSYYESFQQEEKPMGSLMNVLSSYSLAEFSASIDAIYLHPLIHYWAQHRLSIDEKKTFSRQALELVTRALRQQSASPSVGYDAFERRTIPHLQTVLANVMKYLSSSNGSEYNLPFGPPVEEEDRDGVLLTVHRYVENWYLWLEDKVEDFVRESIFWIKGDDITTEETWWVAYKLGMVARNYNYLETETLYRWAFTEARQKYNVRHPRCLAIAGDIAWILYLQRNLAEAKKWYRWVLSARQSVLGETHFATLGAIMGIGRILSEEGDTEAALEMQLSAYRGRARSTGEESVLTLNAAKNVADIYLELGRVDDAWEWLVKVATGRERVLGRYHEDTFRLFFDIAEILFREKKFEDAYTWYQATLTAQEVTFGENHEVTLHTVHKIGCCFFDMQRNGEAVQWYQRALRGYEVTLGMDHRTTLQNINFLAVTLDRLGAYEEAYQWYMRALETQERTLHAYHEDVLLTVSNVGAVLHNLGRFDESYLWYKRALEGNERIVGKDHPQYQHISGNMEFVVGRMDEGRREYQWCEHVLMVWAICTFLKALFVQDTSAASVQ